MTTIDSGISRWRYRVGVGLFVLNLILPLIALILVPLLGFPAGVNTVLFGLSLAGGPELLLMAAAGVMGKEGLEQLFGKLGPWFKRIVAWDSVTQRRYVFGLWVLVLSMLIPVALFYIWPEAVADSQGNATWGFYVIIAADFAFLTAFLILGAPFWERVRAVFTWDARISFPASPSERTEDLNDS